MIKESSSVVSADNLLPIFERTFSRFSSSILDLSLSLDASHVDIKTEKLIPYLNLTNIDEDLNAQLFQAQHQYRVKSLSITDLHTQSQDKSIKQRITFLVIDPKDDTKMISDEMQKLSEYDHRILNRKLNLFYIDPNISPGSVMWTPKGTILFNQLKHYISTTMKENDYLEIMTPAYASLKLWDKSGHVDMFSENMIGYNMDVKDYSKTINNECCLKPMSCPLHCIMFKQMLPTYKDLPVRLFEFGSVNRNEPSGSLHGLLRTKAFTQDDSHIFCTYDQVKNEVCNFISILKKLYYKCGFNNLADKLKIKLSTRPDKYAGTLETWNVAEEILNQVSIESNLDYTILKGEGAFYGPKLEFHLLDKHNRSWQCGTLQLDMVLPHRLDIDYVNSCNTRDTPVLIHHAIVGSMERFIGMLIEHHKGHLPFWLCPVQARIVTVNDKINEYAQNLFNNNDSHVRYSIDNRNIHLNQKIKNAVEEKIPFVITVGNKEMSENTAAIRHIDGSVKTVNKDKITDYIKDKSIEY